MITLFGLLFIVGLCIVFIGFIIAIIIALIDSNDKSDTNKNLNKKHKNSIKFYFGKEEKGKWGEEVVSNKLEQINGYKKIINDIMINDQGKSRQIDHIAITEYGVFVIETKNYSGSIYGKEKSTEWSEYIKGKKYNMKNPIHQNYGHYKIVKNILFDESIYIEPIVVFIDGCKLNVKTQSKVTYASMIVNYIQRKPKVLTEGQINEIYNTIMENRITNKEQIEDHDYNVKKYIEYKDRIVRSGKCPRCGADLVIRTTEKGKFYGCSAYPKCNFTKCI